MPKKKPANYRLLILILWDLQLHTKTFNNIFNRTIFLSPLVCAYVLTELLQQTDFVTNSPVTVLGVLSMKWNLHVFLHLWEQKWVRSVYALLMAKA